MEAIGKVLGDVALPGEAAPAVEKAGGASFTEELGKALGSIEDTELEADREAGKVALGGGNLHETAIALQKADIAMRLATKVRNKLIDAYQEVMKMSV
jgi:flagellar hook-basal body complex protein FliE